MGLVAVTMLYPFLNVIAVAFSDYTAFLENPMRIIPGNFTAQAFIYVFSNTLILSSYRNTIVTTIVGTLLSLVVVVITAYPLSRRGLKGKASLHEPHHLHDALLRRSDPGVLPRAEPGSHRQPLGADPAAAACPRTTSCS